MRLSSLLFICFLTLTSWNSNAQNFTRYGFLEGLENENIVHINQDSDGNLWVATLGGGISMFNGLEFRNYTVRKGLAHNFVMNVFCTQNEIYAVNDLGISVLTGGTFSSNYHHQVVTSALAEGSVFFKNENGKLGELRNEIVYSVPFPDDGEIVQSITALDNAILVLSKSKILYVLDDNKKLVVLHDFNKESQFLYEGNTIWIGSGPEYLKETIVTSNVALPMQLNKSEIRQVLEESPLRVWIIQKGKLFLKNESGVILISGKEGFTDSDVNYLFKDQEENIWVGAADGLYKIHFSKFLFMGSVEPEDKISTITSIGKNQVILGTQKGKLFQIQNDLLKPSALMSSTAIRSYSALFFDAVKNEIWIGTGDQGLFRISNTGRPERLGDSDILSEGTIRHIFRENNGNTWIGTQQGLIRLDVKDSVKTYQVSSGLTDNIIWGVRETEQGTIASLTRKGMDFIKNETVQTDTALQKLGSKRITCFIKDVHGNFWVGTLGFGLLYIDGKSSEIRGFTSDDGLNSDVIVNLIEIRGHVYVGTFKGIDIVSLTPEMQPVIRHLSDEIIPTNFNSFHFESESNRLWFGSNEKCYAYKLEGGHNYPPLISLQKSVITTSSGEIVIEKPSDQMRTLSYQENNIRFEFLGLNLSSPQTVTYSTRLIGWDSTWTRPVKNRVTSFTNLPPGKYKFEVVAYNHDGIKSAASFVNFTISKPVWMEIWFIVSAMIFLITLGAVINRYRISRKLEMVVEMERNKQEVLEKVRKTIARDFHDNMGNKLAGIKMSSNLVGLKLKDSSPEVSELLTYIEKNSQELFEGTKDFIWSIDPESDNLIEVYTYIKDFGEEFFKRTNVVFYSDMSSEKDIVKIPSGWSRQIVLIFKEAMTNTIKHSAGSSAQFQMDIKDEGFVFIYSDDGEGFGDPHPQGKGLNNMKSRAEGISCDLVFGKNQEGKLEIKLSGVFE